MVIALKTNKVDAKLLYPLTKTYCGRAADVGVTSTPTPYTHPASDYARSDGWHRRMPEKRPAAQDPPGPEAHGSHGVREHDHGQPAPRTKYPDPGFPFAWTYPSPPD